MLSRKWCFRRKVYLSVVSETTSSDGTALSPQSSTGFEQVTGFSSDHRFNNLKFISDGNPRTLSQIPNHKNSPMLRGYDLDTREEIQPVPSQSSHSRSATPEPVTKHRCANVISLLRDSPLPSPWRKCLSLWLNQLAAQSLAWARCQPKENNIPHWQAPGKSLAHTRVCFVCSDYLRSRHLLHRREPGTFQSRAPEPATL